MPLIKSLNKLRSHALVVPQESVTSRSPNERGEERLGGRAPNRRRNNSSKDVACSHVASDNTESGDNSLSTRKPKRQTTASSTRCGGRTAKKAALPVKQSKKCTKTPATRRGRRVMSKPAPLNKDRSVQEAQTKESSASSSVLTHLPDVMSASSVADAEPALLAIDMTQTSTTMENTSMGVDTGIHPRANDEGVVSHIRAGAVQHPKPQLSSRCSGGGPLAKQVKTVPGNNPMVATETNSAPSLGNEREEPESWRGKPLQELSVLSPVASQAGCTTDSPESSFVLCVVRHARGIVSTWVSDYTE
ncbi:hypothetical protein TRVL_06232 [Trypanosoma vivax]|nr:hypothetical protein TRVL_06232 [Trypanosoma vivax]